MKRAMAIGVLIVVGIFLVIALCSTESAQRSMKSIKSDINGGLERTVTVYDYNGGEIESWTGKFDVSSSENETYFDIDGKRVIIQGGIVINEEN